MIILARPGNHSFLNTELLEHMTTNARVKSRMDTIPKHCKIIRYGVSTPSPITPVRIMANEATAIDRASNKYTARKLVEETGIRIPETLSVAELSALSVDKLAKFAKGSLLIGRPFHHARGEDVFIVDKITSLIDALSRGAEYFSRVITKRAEFRVHTAHGGVLLVQEKMPADPTEILWNHTNGSIFEVLPWDVIPKGLCPMAVQATNVLGLDFAAIDIIESQVSGDYYFLEANTAPRLEGYTAERYAKYFDWLNKYDTKPEWFNIKGRYIIRDEWYNK